MFTSLFFFLFFETVEPSYLTFSVLMPEHIRVAAFAAPTLAGEHAPKKKTESIGPVLQAASVYAIDVATNTPLYLKDIFTRRPIASIEKLVAAMVILDSHTLDQVVTISKNAAQQEGSRIWLAPGEEITVESLLTGLLVNSGNDAAVALAEFDAGDEASFVRKMNSKVLSLGLSDTHFSNAKGFDDKNNYSTAFDTLRFARAAIDYPIIRRIVSIKKGQVTSTNGKIKHALINTNELLENPFFNVIGLKTGTTPAAGQSFVALIQDPDGHEVMAVILDSPNRFKEMKILIDWIFRNFEFS